MKKIPYGKSDIVQILAENYYYVDKTKFIPLIEQAGDYLFFLRPRRFGKSLWLATLETYYDILNKDKLTAIFKDTWISENLTPDAGKYFILRFNFAMVDPNPDRVEESFNETCLQSIEDFITRYNHVISDKLKTKILSYKKYDRALKALLSRTTFEELQNKLYVLIDEYDNFTNTILSEYSSKRYHEITHGSGFLRYFYNLLKGATTGPDAPVGRIFITGVSPITMDDVTSGFNIGDPISLEPEFNEMAGFTFEEVKEIFKYYVEAGWLNQPLDKLLDIASQWYNNYKFDNNSEVTLYNPDMIFYFVRQTGRRKGIPDMLIDDNVKIDYNKLKHLVIIDKRFNGNFSILQNIIQKGYISGEVASSFPLEDLLEEENFTSHLFYLGLLTFEKGGLLKIPNQTMWKILHDYIRRAYKDLKIFKPHIWQLQQYLKEMAYEGRWEAVFELLSREIKNQSSIRDFLKHEESIKIFLATYINIMDYFIVRTETELNKGFADIYLEPFWERDENVRYGYLIELKYIPRSEKITEGLIKGLRDRAREQLEQYSKDVRIEKKFSARADGELIKIYQIWHGWEMVEIGQLCGEMERNHHLV
ncbi:ATP-binding protein [Desulfothermus naphthae]